MPPRIIKFLIVQNEKQAMVVRKGLICALRDLGEVEKIDNAARPISVKVMTTIGSTTQEVSEYQSISLIHQSTHQHIPLHLPVYI